MVFLKNTHRDSNVRNKGIFLTGLFIGISDLRIYVSDYRELFIFAY